MGREKIESILYAGEQTSKSLRKACAGFVSHVASQSKSAGTISLIPCPFSYRSNSHIRQNSHREDI